MLAHCNAGPFCSQFTAVKESVCICNSVSCFTGVLSRYSYGGHFSTQYRCGIIKSNDYYSSLCTTAAAHLCPAT